METEAAAAVMLAGIARADIRFDYTCSMKYATGQGFSIEVPAPFSRLDAKHVASLKLAFERRYRELYAKLIPELAVEMVTWRVRASGLQPCRSFGAVTALAGHLPDTIEDVTGFGPDGERRSLVPPHRLAQPLDLGAAADPWASSPEGRDDVAPIIRAG